MGRCCTRYRFNQFSINVHCLQLFDRCAILSPLAVNLKKIWKTGVVHGRDHNKGVAAVVQTPDALQTREALFKALSMKVDVCRSHHCAVRHKQRMELQKDSTEVSGCDSCAVAAREKNSPCRYNIEPYTSSAKEQPKSVLRAERMPSKTRGR